MNGVSEKRLPNILVTGANGQLGTSIAMIADPDDARFFFTDVEELDITDAAEVERYIADNRIDILINCAAYTNVEKAEDDEAAAALINAEAPAILARSCRKHGVFMIHVSTDYVFGDGGCTTPYREDARENPLGVYGRTKLAGEKAVRADLEGGAGDTMDDCSIAGVSTGMRPGYLIFRTAWLYSEYGRNFVKTMLSLMESKEKLNVVFDQVGTPTYAADLARTIYDAAMRVAVGEMRAEDCGIYNFSDEGVCSWYDFSVAIEELSRESRGRRCEVLPCHSEEFPSKVRRPSFSVLDKTKVKKVFGASIPHWRVSLKVCLDNLLGAGSDTGKAAVKAAGVVSGRAADRISGKVSDKGK